MTFFVGMDDLHHVHRVDHACISANRLLRRRRGNPFAPPRLSWLMDSSAFTIIDTHGGYPDDRSPAAYVDLAAHWVRLVPGCAAIVTQDFMCEPRMIARTGLTVAEHQRLTVARFDDLSGAWAAVGAPTHLMPVLQGWTADDYRRCLALYGDRIKPGAWVGVGSVCKRQGNPRVVVEILRAIRSERPDIETHGFGVKRTALKDPDVLELLTTADSMAWAFHERKNGRDAHDPAAAIAFAASIEAGMAAHRGMILG